MYDAIRDKSGVLGLGGIIGGTRSGTEFSTKNILKTKNLENTDCLIILI